MEGITVPMYRRVQRKDPSYQPTSKKKKKKKKKKEKDLPTLFYPLSFCVLLNHTCLIEEFSAFEVCLEEKISFAMFSLQRTWGLGSSKKAQKDGSVQT